MIRVVDNKKLDLTDSEWELYQKICKSYDNPPHVQGKDLFKGLFETDKNGFIVYLIPPNKQQTTMEVFMFLVSVMIHQHLGSACELADKKHSQMNDTMKKAESMMARLKKNLDDSEKIIDDLKNAKRNFFNLRRD